MKTRNGFVSNSSSSSFIISVKTSKKCKHCGHKLIDILDKIRLASESSFDNSVNAEGLKEVINFYAVDKDDSNDVKMLEKIKKFHAAHKSETIAAVSISYHDTRLLDELYDTPGVTILKDYN